ncbi:class I SAM-dependent methyltransferase [Phreatobacter oligotrophus]|uniref:class I SAM-dependent methyltransferase n=1 Tax=Phreatobacter oligotrophus TaxID=1122261 RepID=UPI0023579D4A|nr:class I SAM-dependent methyltransferase [Phreatobacter oligotrophus]MBX9989286.1 class I SAM-dependent methyltransferase [Phreatobacter oligotrophus]
MTTASTAGYGREADNLAVQYESITFEQVHAPVLHLLPEAPGHALDIGAGTGRDAAALAARGFSVVAVEPTAELRAHGARIHAGRPIIWLDDGLPDLAVLAGRAERFDLILLTAVWMHLDADEREQAMARLADLAQPGARIVMTLRHGPIPEGRRMFEVSAAETVALAARNGLASLFETSRPDMFGRPGVTWSVLVLSPSA